MDPPSDTDTLLNVTYSVFLPPKLPQAALRDDAQSYVDLCLAHLVLEAIDQYRKLTSRDLFRWAHVHRMLSHLAEDIRAPFTKDTLTRNMTTMRSGDVLALHIREQNAAVLVRKNPSDATFEIFEVQAPNAAVMSTPGQLVREFPGPAVQVSDSVFYDPGFIEEISNFLAHMNLDTLEGSSAKTTKAGSTVSEVRDSAHPHYISRLFVAILRGVGKELEPNRVVKRIADEVLWNDAYLPWRRSPLWLIMRVAVQTSLSSTDEYKHFMVFLHAQLLSLCHDDPHFPHDLLFVMRTKLARRLLKVQDSAPDFLVHAISDTTIRIEETLQGRWTQIQTRVPNVAPLHVDCEAAIIHSIPNTQKDIETILRTRPSNAQTPPFIPDDMPRFLEPSDFSVFDQGALSNAFAASKHIALFDFESCVSKNLSGWVDNNLYSESACSIVNSCLEQYTSAALPFYTQDAADRSIMILTVATLWVALDRLATTQHPLLLDYSPEIPESMLDVLLLHSSQHLEQARNVQLHLRRRHTDSKNTAEASVFTEKHSDNSFIVRYFDQSSNLQALKATIEESAHRERDSKLQEMESMNAEYARIMKLVREMNCRCPPKVEERPRACCRKCQTQDVANQMRIDVHEWPLPANEPDAKAVIFELGCPDTLNYWRSVTYYILCDLGRSPRNTATPPCTLADYENLRPWSAHLKPPIHRITIASATKPFVRSHYKNTKIPASQSGVCVKNGLTFKFYDLTQRAWATKPFLGASFAYFGTLALPERSPYRYLQYAVEGVSHTSNQVLANQSDCPQDISLHEHYAFGMLRSGPRLQWINIARGLEENCLSFNRIEVDLLHTQAAWQIGPLSLNNQSRDWHMELEDPQYGRLLVAQALRVLNRVRENWLESISVRTAVMLVTRLLASTYDNHIQQEVCKFLREARRVTFKWLQDLLAKLQGTGLESQVSDYQRRICEMAAICRSTYDVDTTHIPKLFFTTKDYDVVMFCSAILYDNQPFKLSYLPASLQALLCRDRRFTHKIAPTVIKALRCMPRLLDGAISLYWDGFQPGSTGWYTHSESNLQWVSTMTGTTGERSSQLVHLNLFEGRLLVDGKSLGRLPKEYTSHPTYIRLFGQKVLDVVPSSSRGMPFTARSLIEGNEVSFHLEASTRKLIIRTQIGGVTFELMSSNCFLGDFPLFFLSDYHHWLNLQTGAVEFRPLLVPWSSCDENWRLCPTSQSTYTMQRITENQPIFLLSSHGPMFRSIINQLCPLEDPRYISATILTTSPQRISVELPRMKLTFFVNENQQLESDNFRGLVVDDSQSTGTMFGLYNQLVLCTKSLVEQLLPRSRCVLIPHGTVDFAAYGGHVHVTINHGSSQHIVFHQYKVDADLGCLAGSVGLTSRLFKLYLHALTSYFLPDPLTGRTGTEEALHELSEPSTSSFDEIDVEQAHLLQLIGGLTPKRSYYPIHLQSMMTTHWHDISPITQHYAFGIGANSILNRAHALRLFNSSNLDAEPFITNFDSTLLERAANRTRACYPLDIAIRLPTVAEKSGSSQTYVGRDSLATGWTEKAQVALWASNLVYAKWGTPIYAPHNLVSLAESWGIVRGPSYKGLVLTYSSNRLLLDLPQSWINLYNSCRQATIHSDKYKLCICLASATYSNQLPRNLVPTLLAFATNPQFSEIAPPSHPSYQLSDGYKPTRGRIRDILSARTRGVENTPAGQLRKKQNESTENWIQRKQNCFDANISELGNELARAWINDWQSFSFVPPLKYSSWFSIWSCTQQVRLYFNSCLKNLELATHLREVENTLTSRPATLGLGLQQTALHVAEPTQKTSGLTRFIGQPYLEELMQHRLCPNSANTPPGQALSISKGKGHAVNTTRLKSFLADFRDLSAPPLNQLYGTDLEASRVDLEKVDASLVSSRLQSPRQLEGNRHTQRGRLQDKFQEIRVALGPSTAIEAIVSTSGIWPRITPRAILGRLALWARASISPAWQKTLAEYARAYIEYQRSQRLINLAIEGKQDELSKELGSTSIASGPWNNHPDWLLVQIEGNFSIRAIQARVASEMISPSSHKNTILQLNMGEGKSSVIVPIIAASLADSSQLVRVVVLKPLWRQMFHLLVNRLAGLVGRRIYYLPFNRHIRVDHENASQIQKLHAECMREGGVLLVQPEHILSFKLMGVDRLISSASPEEARVANTLHTMQQWLFDHTRDILDESDEILHVRYQLIYTVGERLPLEGHPDRWTTTQQILPLVAKHIGRLKQRYPDKLKHEARSSGQFPFIRIMPGSDETIIELLQSVASDAMAGHIPNLNFGLLSQKNRENVFELLTKKDLSEDGFALLEEFETTVRNGLLLLRGLLACGILAFALRDRHYRVDYGLHLSRSLLAVPYRAKDIPSPRAEFGHPDVAVVLTCLSYHYHGLTRDQLTVCFKLLYKLDNPASEYEQWVRGNTTIPPQLRQLNGVNLKDRTQFDTKILPTFSCNSAVVDFFLSSVVFPKSAKQFTHKLSTSGWDLAEAKNYVTTGFSGTNDNRYLLPVSISQSDPVKQSSTNALVLTYLLQPENNHYVCIRGAAGKTCSAKEFLRILVIQDPEIRVLLDVGAQMLDLQNYELVKYWLELRPDVSAAIYFNDRDELVVLPRNGSPTSFFSSPFAQQLDKCIVYLDDGHTRGTDLDLPGQTRAAVTLGPKVTKDRLLQGCMRMRKLGRGQSVMFCAPAEVDAQIRKAALLTAENRVDALDVLRWTMLETCKDLEHHTSHWAQQGLEHSRRTGQQTSALANDNSVLKNNWMTPEYKSLKDTYGVSSSATYSSESFMSKAFAIPAIKERLFSLGICHLDDPSMGEEQEREVSQETEQERQIERPLKSYPATHSVHEDIRHFVQTGMVPKQFKGLVSLFCPISLSGFPKPGTWSPKLLASVDFCGVLKPSAASRPVPGEYMRPVNWLLSGSNGTLVVLTPYEADKLICEIRNSQNVRLHTYCPRITRSMRSFSDLCFYTIPARPNSPSLLIDPTAQLQLNLFAGQLYLDSYSQYLSLCHFLGIYSGADTNYQGDDEIHIQSDGFIAPSDRQRIGNSKTGYIDCGFRSSPIGALKELTGYRRKGMDFLRTHIGQILHARQLKPKDF